MHFITWSAFHVSFFILLIDYKNYYYTIIQTVTYFLALFFFVLSSCLSPGKLQKSKSVPFMHLLLNFDPIQLCPDCEIIRTKRSRHCTICNSCVERFDHHCPWINNCVGIKNHNSFMAFLICIIILLLSNFTIFGLSKLSFFSPIRYHFSLNNPK